MRTTKFGALLASALLFTNLTTGTSPAWAEEKWPSRPITLYMGFSAGSGVDVVARIIQESMSEQLGEPVIIDYKSGAAGNIASDFVARANPDGYTFVFGTAATHGSNAILYKDLSFDVEQDFIPVAPVLDVSNVLMVNPEVMPAKTIKEFVEIIKANPGQYNYASTGNGTGTHMAFAEFNSRLGLDMLHIPYKGGPDALASVVNGETCCIMNQVQTALPFYKAGKVNLLGVTTAKPVAAIPEIPTIASSGVSGAEGFDSSIWFGVFAPKGTDPAIVAKLNSVIRTAIQEPEIKAKYEAMGNSIRVETPEQFKETVHQNLVKWAKVIEDAGIESY